MLTEDEALTTSNFKLNHIAKSDRSHPQISLPIKIAASVWHGVENND